MIKKNYQKSRGKTSILVATIYFYSNGAILDDFYHISHQPKVFLIDTNTSTPKP